MFALLAQPNDIVEAAHPKSLILTAPAEGGDLAARLSEWPGVAPCGRMTVE
jgi:hypothetical protein